jgi:phosphoglucosamine mutase
MKRLDEAARRVETDLGQEGRVLIRWSGTEPKLRIMVEGPDEGRIRGLLADLVEAARRDVPLPES